MLNTLWHLRGAVPLDGIADGDALDRIEGLLDLEGKAADVRDADHVSFSATGSEPILPTRWLAMTVYDRGTFRIGQDGKGGRVLWYDLSSLNLLFLCLLAAAAFFGFGMAFEDRTTAICYALFAFGWLYGGNIVLGRLRIPRVIRRAVHDR